MNKPIVSVVTLVGLITTSWGLLARGEESSPLSIAGYAEAYYLHDFNDPAGRRRPGFVFSHDRTDRPEVNLALVEIDYGTATTRANLGIAAGTYMQANYAAEPRALRNVFEANVGFKVSDRHDVWLDVGVLPSHIGFESAIGKDNWTVTRSTPADNSPYFETGARISYTSADSRWYASALLLNGWQRIKGPDGNSTPSLGLQLTYSPTERLTLNSSFFAGNDKSDAQRQMRYFNNFYAQYQLSDAWSVTAAIDLGAEQKAKGSSRYNTWYAPVLIVRYAATEKLSFAARAEHYHDRNQVIVDTGTPNGLRLSGISFNVDYQLTPNILWRAELRGFDSRDAVFPKEGSGRASDSVIAVTALAISF